MLKFIKGELVEAAMLRTPVSIGPRNPRELANILYLALLCVEILRHEDPALAQHYARLTINFGDFDHMRASTTDTANLIAILSNQDDYKEYMEPDYDVSAPVLLIKGYLRGVWQDSYYTSLTRQFFMKTEVMLDIGDSTLRQCRRNILDWDILSDNERRMTKSNIRRELAQRAIRLDIGMDLLHS